ncbi:unnamed protein product [Plutella xylostella]|uniref:(diamondback moth) hypothetical protein n=1 Tax=Plutella xylostella TaxID=51655 RepID=A0A8S4FW04_PLUXY|nr:unnamed protein product [Plutella xylostella]
MVDPDVKCDQCPRTFHTVSHMRAHHGSVHRRRHVFACGACGVTYAKRETVRRHAAAAQGTHGGKLSRWGSGQHMLTRVCNSGLTSEMQQPTLEPRGPAQSALYDDTACNTWRGI